MLLALAAFRQMFPMAACQSVLDLAARLVRGTSVLEMPETVALNTGGAQARVPVVDWGTVLALHCSAPAAVLMEGTRHQPMMAAQVVLAELYFLLLMAAAARVQALLAQMLRRLIAVAMAAMAVTAIQSAQASLVVLAAFRAVAAAAQAQVQRLLQAAAMVARVARSFIGGKENKMRAAQINEQNVVINFAEVGGFDAQFIDPLDAVAGAIWDGTRFHNPPAPEAPSAVRHITNLAFRNRFTTAEKVAIEMAALDNPASTMAARLQAAAIRVNLADTAAARYIDLDRADTRQGVQNMEAAGLLAAGRATTILDAPVLDVERAST